MTTLSAAFARIAAATAAAALSAGAALASPMVTNSTQYNAPYAVSNTDLLQTHLVSTSSTGDFSREGATGLPALTDGVFGGQGNQGAANGGAAATADGSNSVTFVLDTGNGYGWNLQSIATYAGWDLYRGGQSYTVSYATIYAPNNFVLLAAEHNNTTATQGVNVDTRAVITDTTGTLASNVVAIRFNFNGDLQYGYAGYREIDVTGTPSVPEPSSLLLCAGALTGLVAARRRKQQR